MVLAVTSQYFQDVLYCSREAVQTVKMTDIDHSVMMKYISYIYTGNIDMPSTEDIWKLLRSKYSPPIANMPTVSLYALQTSNPEHE